MANEPMTRERAAELLAGYAEAHEDNVRRYGDTDSGRGVVALRLGAYALREVDRLEWATLTLGARAAELERHLAEARMLARYLTGQPCLCEQPALPVTGGPLCAPCDAAAWLSQFPGQPKPDAAGRPAQPATDATARCPNVRCRAAHEERHRALGAHDGCCEHLDGCPPATGGGQCAACRKSESGACWPHAAARFGQASGKQWTVIACQRGDQPATDGDGQ